MDIYEAIKKRRSVRSYKPDPVPEESLERVLEAARLAPSAKNKQDWKFIVVKDSEKRRKLSIAANNQEFVAEAPVVIVGVALDPDYVMSSEIPGYAVNLAIAMEHIALAAAAERLGTCWIGAFSQEEVKKLFNIPDKYKVVALMPLGVPAEKAISKPRKSIEEVICYENFSE